MQPQPNSLDEAKTQGAARTMQLMRAGSLQFGIVASEIAAIAPWREPAPLPQAPKSVLGVVSVHGRMLTVLDLASLAQDSSATTTAAQQLVALRGDEQLALAVDELGETIEIEDAAIKPKRDNPEAFASGVLQRDGTDIYILNPKELFPTAIQGRERRRRRF